MSKKPLELYVVLGQPPGSALAAKIWLEAKGDLYMTTYEKALAGKFSYHEWGVSHVYSNLTARRSGIGKPAGPNLRGLKGFRDVAGLAYGWPPDPSGYEPKKDTKTRRTLMAPAPVLGWYLKVWAIEPGRKDLADKIATTDPWPTVPVRAVLLADLCEPWILVTVSYWANDHPYQVVYYEPRIPGRVAMEVIPRPYEGTWLESSEPKWRPGQP